MRQRGTLWTPFLSRATSRHSQQRRRMRQPADIYYLLRLLDAAVYPLHAGGETILYRDRHALRALGAAARLASIALPFRLSAMSPYEQTRRTPNACAGVSFSAGHGWTWTVHQAFAAFCIWVWFISYMFLWLPLCDRDSGSMPYRRNRGVTMLRRRGVDGTAWTRRVPADVPVRPGGGHFSRRRNGFYLLHSPASLLHTTQSGRRPRRCSPYL